MKKVKTFGEYEELAHRTVEYPSNKAIRYLAGELLKQTKEVAKRAEELTEYSEDAKYEAIQERLGKALLYLTELSKYAVYLGDGSHTPNSALEYIACKSLNSSFKKIRNPFKEMEEEW